MSKRLNPRVEKVFFDDFAPRFEYPESMKNLEEYCKKSGYKYGKYVEENPDEPKPKVEEPFMRTCSCGRKFVPRMLKDGITVSNQKRCITCINEERAKKGKCPLGERTVICQWCQKEIVGAVGGQKYHKECKKEMLKKKRDEQKEREKQNDKD